MEPAFLDNSGLSEKQLPSKNLQSHLNNPISKSKDVNLNASGNLIKSKRRYEGRYKYSKSSSRGSHRSLKKKTYDRDRKTGKPRYSRSRSRSLSSRSRNYRSKEQSKYPIKSSGKDHPKGRIGDYKRSKSKSNDSNSSDCPNCLQLIMDCKICRKEKKIFDREYFMAILQERERNPQSQISYFDDNKNLKRASNSNAKSKTKSKLHSRSRSFSEKRDVKKTNRFLRSRTRSRSQKSKRANIKPNSPVRVTRIGGREASRSWSRTRSRSKSKSRERSDRKNFKPDDYASRNMKSSRPSKFSDGPPQGLGDTKNIELKETKNYIVQGYSNDQLNAEGDSKKYTNNNMSFYDNKQLNQKGNFDREKERDRERDREKDRDREREREKERQRDRDRERDRERENRERNHERDRVERDRDREKKLSCSLSPSENEPKTLFVSYTDQSLSQQEIKNHFEQFGEIKDIRYPQNKRDKSNYCFLEFVDDYSVDKAITNGKRFVIANNIHCDIKRLKKHYSRNPMGGPKDYERKSSKQYSKIWGDRSDLDKFKEKTEQISNSEVNEIKPDLKIERSY